AVPGGEVDVVGADATGAGGAQAVVVAQVGVADPARGGRAAVAAVGVPVRVAGALRGVGRQRLATVMAGRPRHGGGYWASDGARRVACCWRGRRPCRRQLPSAGASSTIQSWPSSSSRCTRQPVSLG